MDNVQEINENQCIEAVDNSVEKLEEQIETISLKSNQSINESNLMVIPFISLQKSKVKILERYWESNGVKRGIKVVGSAESGCPTIAELDVLLGLFRILIKNVGFKYEYNRTTGRVNLPRTIHFTYQELSEELGYKKYGGTVKKQLEKSIKTLIETTIYSDLGIRDAEEGDYIVDFKGLESSRILFDYKSYSYTKKKKMGEKIGNAKQIKEQQSVNIDEFFFKNICNNFFKIYDYGSYIKLTKGFSKKIYLLLSQWSHSYEKFLYYNTLYDFLSLQVETASQQYYYNRLIKDALDELKTIGFINDFEIDKSKGVNFIFNAHKKMLSKKLDKYKTPEEVIDKLQSYGFTMEEWTKYYRLDNEEYVKGLLRYVEDRVEKGLIPKPKEYLKKGLQHENYNVTDYMG